MNLASRSSSVKLRLPNAIDDRPKDAAFRIMRHVLGADLSYGQRVLLLRILEHDRFGESRYGCTASLETLASEIGTDRRRLRRMLRPLIDDGWLVAGRRQGNERPLRAGPHCLVALQSGGENHPCLNKQVGAKKTPQVGAKKTPQVGAKKTPQVGAKKTPQRTKEEPTKKPAGPPAEPPAAGCPALEQDIQLWLDGLESVGWRVVDGPRGLTRAPLDPAHTRWGQRAEGLWANLQAHQAETIAHLKTRTN